MGGRPGYRAIIKESGVQMRYTERILMNELCKPAGERDAALVDECIQTLAYLNARIDCAIAQEQARRRARPFYRTGFGIAAFVVLLLLAGSGIAEACGFRVWSALLHWDAGYLHVDYVPEGQGMLSAVTPKPDDAINKGFSPDTEYSSVDEALEALKISPMLPVLPDSFEIERIHSRQDDIGTKLFINYAGVNGSLSFKVSVYYNEDTSSAVLLPGAPENHETYTGNGISFRLSRAGGKIYATWSHGDCIYYLDTDLSYKETMNVLDTLAFPK